MISKLIGKYFRNTLIAHDLKLAGLFRFLSYLDAVCPLGNLLVYFDAAHISRENWKWECSLSQSVAIVKISVY